RRESRCPVDVRPARVGGRVSADTGDFRERAGRDIAGGAPLRGGRFTISPMKTSGAPPLACLGGGSELHRGRYLHIDPGGGRETGAGNTAAGGLEIVFLVEDIVDVEPEMIALPAPRGAEGGHVVGGNLEALPRGDAERGEVDIGRV